MSNVDFGAVAAESASKLASTAGAVGSMSMADFLGSLVVLGTLAFVWGLTTWLILVGFEKDRRDRRLHALEKRFGNAGRAEDFSQAGVLLGFKENMRGVIDRSLPEAFRLKPHQQFKNLMCNSHEWGSVFFRYDPVSARPVRTIIVAAAFFDVMFIEAIAYEQTKPQEPGGLGGCTGSGSGTGAPTFEQVDSQEECECLKAGEYDVYHKETGRTADYCATGAQPMDTTQPNCKWDAEDETCSFNEPEETFVSTIILSVIISILTVPFGLLQGYLLENYLAPPTLLGKKKKKKTAEEELEEEEAAERSEEQLEELIEEETEILLHHLENQRGEIVEKIIDANRKHLKMKREYGRGVRTFNQKKFAEVTAEVREWQQQLRKFDKAHGFGKDGKLKPGGGYQRMTGSTAYQKLKKRVAKEIEETEELLTTLHGSANKYNFDSKMRDMAMKDSLMFEQHRMDRLSFVARRIYTSNKLAFEDEAAKPIPVAKKYFGWIFLIFILLLETFYVWSFALAQGPAVANHFLLVFIISLVQDMLVYMPLKLLILNLLMPAAVKSEVRQAHNDMSSNAGDFKFKEKFAVGAASRCALLDYEDAFDSRSDPDRIQRDPMQSSKIIIEANSLQELTPQYQDNPPPKESRIARRKRKKQEKEAQRRRMQMKREAEAKSKATIIALFIVFLLVLMPDDIQELVVETFVTTVHNLFVLGVVTLHELHISAAVVPVVFIIIVCYGFYLHRKRLKRISKMVTKAPPTRIEAFMNMLTRRKMREYMADTAGVEITGAGLEASMDIVATDEFTTQNPMG